MRIAARMLAIFFIAGIAIVAAYAASFSISNQCNEAITAVVHFSDATSEQVHADAYSSLVLDIGERSVTAVTINSQTVNVGTKNQPVHLASGTKIYVSVESTGSVYSIFPVE